MHFPLSCLVCAALVIRSINAAENNEKLTDQESASQWYNNAGQPDSQRRLPQLPCLTNNGDSGICRPATLCPGEQPAQHSTNPSICFYLLFVCCPTETIRQVQNTASSDTKKVSVPRTPPQVSTPLPPATRTPSRVALQINPPGCGLRQIPTSVQVPMIAGGTRARRDSWPWMVAIRRMMPNGRSKFLCGGSLITRAHVLSAAHCFGEDESNRLPNQFVALVGSYYRGDNDTEFVNSGVASEVISITVHEEYEDSTNDHDIAILRLQEKNVPSQQPVPVCLPTQITLPDPSVDVFVTGWGDEAFGGRGSDVLKEARLVLVQINRCRQVFMGLTSLRRGITPNVICAEDPVEASDACQGDSGGPLVMEQSGRWTQLGIVSFGLRCGERGYPGVYTRTASYLSWINAAVQNSNQM